MRIIFVCAGNICRSSTAERYLRKLAPDRGLAGMTILSRGLIATVGEAPAAATVVAAGRLGVDVSDHRAVRFDPEELVGDDLVFVMEESQRRDVIDRAGHDPALVRLLGALAPNRADEVTDPEYGPQVDHDRCADHLAAAVDELIKELATR